MIDNNVQMFREVKGLSRKDLADRSGVSYNYIYQLETGRRDLLSCSFMVGINLATVLDVEPWMLIRKMEDDPNEKA